VPRWTPHPFICRNIPPDESFVINPHFRKEPRVSGGYDFSYLAAMIHDSFMSSPDALVVNGGKMGFAMETPTRSIGRRIKDQIQPR